MGFRWSEVQILSAAGGGRVFAGRLLYADGGVEAARVAIEQVIASKLRTEAPQVGSGARLVDHRQRCASSPL